MLWYHKFTSSYLTSQALAKWNFNIEYFFKRSCTCRYPWNRPLAIKNGHAPGQSFTHHNERNSFGIHVQSAAKIWTDGVGHPPEPPKSGKFIPSKIVVGPKSFNGRIIAKHSDQRWSGTSPLFDRSSSRKHQMVHWGDGHDHNYRNRLSGFVVLVRAKKRSIDAKSEPVQQRN